MCDPGTLLTLGQTVLSGIGLGAAALEDGAPAPPDAPAAPPPLPRDDTGGQVLFGDAGQERRTTGSPSTRRTTDVLGNLGISGGLGL